MSRKTTISKSSNIRKSSDVRKKSVSRATVKVTPLSFSSVIYPKSWDSDKKSKQRRLLNQYAKAGLYPFFRPIKTGVGSRASNELLHLSVFENIESNDLLVEKQSFLTKEQKSMNWLSTAGNQIQARVNKNLKFSGFYFQDGTPENPLPHFSRSKEIIVDSDEAGHFLAYTNNMYAFKDSNKKNVRFDNQGELQKADKIKAHRFFSKSIVDSASYERNKFIAKILKDEVGLKLAYRDSDGKTKNVAVSEQKLAICKYLYSKDVVLDVQTPDRKISFDYDLQDIDDNAIIKLEFIPDKRKVQNLNSDDLLNAIVQRHQIEPDTTQALLENLYHSGWINYPRADIEKAEDVPIKLVKPIEDFRGGVLEKNILQMIDNANNAFASGENYIQFGNWVLKADNKIIAKEKMLNFADMPKTYNDEEMNITVRTEGKTRENITDYLISEKIATPATRTVMLSQMKQAGIISVKDSLYQLDTRGIIFASAYEVLKQKSFTAIDLKRKLDKAQSISEFKQILSNIRPIDDFVKNEIVKMMNVVLEYEDDLKRIDAV
ncbi:hypothetical protein ES704_02999 [subsurface metagenome]